MKINLSGWIIITLIILFFAIPICGLFVADEVASWPKCAEAVTYSFFRK